MREFEEDKESQVLRTSVFNGQKRWVDKTDRKDRRKRMRKYKKKKQENGKQIGILC